MEPVKQTLKHADFVFCNEDEGSAFATANGLEASDREGVAKLIASGEKANQARPRVVIVTQGAEPTIVCTCQPGQEPAIELIPIDPIESELIVDTNGAGDAFVGGFFSELAKGSDVPTAVRKGNELGGRVIQRSGVTFE